MVDKNMKMGGNNFVIQRKSQDIRGEYKIVKELGSGAYGIVYEAVHKQSGDKRAIKAILIDSLDDRESFENEVSILRQLDHPNIVKLYEIYEFNDTFYLVMELCEGGELFHYITKQKHLKEAQAAKIMRQIFSAIAYLHSFKICHRDIKPENFLLKFPDDESTVKLIDFGLSKQVNENEQMNDPNGTPFYIAPEILDGEYTVAVDNWSLGVLLYIMLSGSPPFFGKENKEILRAVKKAVYTLSLKPFQKCSIEVKDLISKLLVKNVEKRYTSEQAYNHPWVQQQVEQESKDIAIDPEVVTKIHSFMEQKALKKAILLYVAQQIPENELENLKHLFVKMDKNGNGTLSLDEFQDAFDEFQEVVNIKKKFTEEEIIRLFKAVDANDNGVIDYSEFIAVFAENHLYKTEKYLKMAFEKFDLDKNGKINPEELRKLLGGGSLVPMDEVESIIEQADTDRDGELDFEEILVYVKQARGRDNALASLG